MYIAPIFTECRILFSLNHVEFWSITSMFTEGRICFFNHFQFWNIAPIFTEVRILFFNTMLSLKIGTFFRGRQYVVFYHVFKYSDNSRFANIFLFCSISLVDCLLYVIAQKKIISNIDLYEDNFFLGHTSTMCSSIVIIQDLPIFFCFVQYL